jgi:hypothetical protein
MRYGLGRKQTPIMVVVSVGTPTLGGGAPLLDEEHSRAGPPRGETNGITCGTRTVSIWPPSRPTRDGKLDDGPGGDQSSGNPAEGFRKAVLERRRASQCGCSDCGSQ